MTLKKSMATVSVMGLYKIKFVKGAYGGNPF